MVPSFTLKSLQVVVVLVVGGGLQDLVSAPVP